MRKRILCLLLCLCIAVSLPLTALAQQERNVIHIRNVDDFLDLAKNCVLDRYSQGKTVYLECDLDLTGADFDGIPTFGGTFEGNGHTVFGLKLAGPSSAVGLFRYLQQGGVVRNLKVSGHVTPDGTAAIVGGIVGSNRGLLADCCYEGTVAGSSNVGGIVGVNEDSGSILRCTSQGVVVGENMTGGIVGMNRGLVENCENQACVNIHTPDASLDLSNIDLGVLMDPSSLTAGVTVMDTGGIAGYSIGAIYDCVNAASIGYPHIGYNVGGIVGRSSGLVSGCVNRASIQGRKDVGGIVGQMEPNVSLDLSEDYLQQLQTQAGELEELIRQLQVSFDQLSVTSVNLNNTLAHIDGISVSLEELTGYIGKYGNELTDEVNRTSLLLQDAVRQFLPVMEQATALSESLETTVRLLAESMSAFADTAVHLEASIALMNDALGELQIATAHIAHATDQITQGVKLLASGLQVKDSKQVESALKQILASLEEFSAAAGQAGEAAGKIAEALQQQGNWDDETAAGFADAMQSLADMSDALQTMADGLTVLMDNLSVDVNAFWKGADKLSKGMQSLTLAMNSLQAATDKLSLSLTFLEQAANRGGQALNILAASMEKMADSMKELTDLVTLVETAVTNISHYEPFQLPQLDSSAQASADNLFDNINAISDELRGILSVSDTFSGEAKELLNAIFDKFKEMLSTAMKLTDHVLDTTTGGLIKDTSDADIEAVKSGKVTLCCNEGAVNADINAGGIAGAMAIEYQMDPEDDFTVQLSQHRLQTYQAKAIILQCTNVAPVQGKRSYVGSICGRMNMGIIANCGAFGGVTSTEGDYVGGIAGIASGPIRRCIVKADLSGGKYVGGVAGLATAVTDCRTMVQLAGREFVGTILGYAEMDDLERISANLYFALPDSPGAIDGISYDGCAQNAPWETFLNSTDVQQFTQTQLSFCYADGTVRTVILPVGAVLMAVMIPALENTEQYIRFWEGLEAQLGEKQYFNRVFVEMQKAKTTVLESEQTRPDGKPVVLLQGSFLGAEKLSLQPLTDVSDSVEGWCFAVPEGGAVTHLRYAIPADQAQVQIWIRNADGVLQEVSYTQSGSYAVFPLEEGVTAFYVTVPARESTWTPWIIAGTALLAAGIVALLLLRRKKKKAK